MYKHICSHCKKKFEIKHKIDTDKALCNKCFKELLKLKDGISYMNFIGDCNGK